MRTHADPCGPTEDIASLETTLRSCHTGFCSVGPVESDPGRARTVLEILVPWTFRAEGPLPRRAQGQLPAQKWKVAVVGAHPSLCADIATAAHAALGGQSEHRYFGLSCPEHHAASHHCSFRCEVSETHLPSPDMNKSMSEHLEIARRVRCQWTLKTWAKGTL